METKTRVFVLESTSEKVDGWVVEEWYERYRETHDGMPRWYLSRSLASSEDLRHWGVKLSKKTGHWDNEVEGPLPWSTEDLQQTASKGMLD